MSKRTITRCYLEITNICNLNCLFCPKTERSKRTMQPDEFDRLTDRLKGRIKFLYFHLMGEPLIHPHLPQFITTAREKGFIPVITTNGTLLPRAQAVMDAQPHKIQISLHSHEGNGLDNYEEYLDNVMKFSLAAAEKGIIIVIRLWNRGGYESNNDKLIEMMAQYCPHPWKKSNESYRLSDRIYLEFDNMFEWPEGDREEYGCEESFCYALRNQIGVLVDGTVVPAASTTMAIWH